MVAIVLHGRGFPVDPWSVVSHYHDTCPLRRRGQGRYSGLTAAGGAHCLNKIVAFRK